MTNTLRYSELSNRLAELEDHLITKEFSDIGDYEEQVKDMARGYRLLAHAEIESYLEDVVRQIADKTLAKWQASNIGSKELISVLAALKNDPEISDRQLFSLKTTEETVNYSFVLFKKRITKNNGIKEKDVKALMSPIGFDIEALIPELVPLLDSFGTKRGEVAHSTSLKKEINPKDEVADVKNIHGYLEKLDQKMFIVIESLT
ncbi:HEPN domain-containing protein [Pseudomonas sp. EL_65y_Pfl2_R96]|uniref:HEPN domain-containing protein n=1 Tax=Pseudomonas sp. EL_65y_Pfl2_R96 TaxID=3088699 RepID=UPI0030D7A7A7